MNRYIISGANRSALIFWILVLLVIIVVVTAHEFVGERGLQDTLFFNVLGYFIYPIFYGSCLLGIWRLAVVLHSHDKYLMVQNGELFVGGKSAGFLSEVQIVKIEPTAVFLNELIVERSFGQPVRIKTYLLSRSAEAALKDLDTLCLKFARSGSPQRPPDRP